MPELPDILLYLHALEPRIVGKRVMGVRLASPFLLRSVAPPLSAIEGRAIVGLRRLGKRVVLEAEGELFLVFHLMIAGRFRWKPAASPIPGRVGLFALDFEDGTLILTEAGSKRQASLYLVEGVEALAQHDPGGLEVLEIDMPTFARALRRDNHTLKRALTDPHLFSGIGNAYSDEILHAARMSPFKQTGSITDEEMRRLYEATRRTLAEWIARLQEETGDNFPEKVTAFRKGMAVHGRYREPCPDCGAPIQRIVYAANEANYCANCQTGGRLFADRSLSRLLKQDWPRTLEQLEKKR
ncbi:MAG TPA: DNA-formamidopyrimidine glycosylase family protein [Vicinamibacterales bacterium]|nr:DNA-formamidopyrimidine glycosylase family protein [Vicinamibacterales bacterium]